jgi:RNA polymerase sigma-70 factor (ECF subfamily)
MTPAQDCSSRGAASDGASPAGDARRTITDDGLAAFMSVRPRLFGIAYRMLGNAAEAEDVVQDAWVRWQLADRSVVREAPAFLVTTVTRLALNVLQSARSRRELSVEPCHPEPADTATDPWRSAERRQALSCGVLLLLEALTPTERTAYILREAFDYPYRAIASALRLKEAHARQLVTRARQRLAAGRRTPANSIEHARLLEAFLAAVDNGDIASLHACAGFEPHRLPPRRQRLAMVKADLGSDLAARPQPVAV